MSHCNSSRDPQLSKPTVLQCMRINADGKPEKNVQDAPKRSALSCLNGPHNATNAKYNVLSKNNAWRITHYQPPVQSTSQPAEPTKFSIFEDKMPIPTSEPSPKECELPEYVMKLYKDSAEVIEDDGKENAFWSFPDPPKDVLGMRQVEERWTAPFRREIYLYLKVQEKKCRPNLNHIRTQKDITPQMRTILVDWMIEVGEEYNFQEETVHLAVSYTDRFLSVMCVGRSKLQLVGTTALFIAAKLHEIYAPELKDFVYITDNTYTKKDILRMEQVLLMAINFFLAPPTAHSFLQVYSSMASSTETVTMLAQYICEISMLDLNLLLFLPSQIGAACLALANYILDSNSWPKELAHLSEYDLDDIDVIAKCLFEKYVAIANQPQKAVYEKYKSSKYQRVACIQCPTHLDLKPEHLL